MAADTRIRRAARKSGLTVGYISRVMNGRRTPRLATAKLIADAMNVSLDRLYQLIEAKRGNSTKEQRERSAAISLGLKLRDSVRRGEHRAARGFEDQGVDYVGRDEFND